jgi:putative N6-adenine-specific DNA methylase
MNLFDTTGEITITCHKWFAPWLERELRELDMIPEETFVTGIRLSGTLTDCIRLNLNLRCASQVLYKLKEFHASNADEIYSEALNFNWEELLSPGTYFSITSNVQNSTINNNLYANLRVKDAIVDRIREMTGVRPETGSELIGAVIHLYWKDNDAALYLDTSGDSLGRHGYRKIPGKAPMLESLAAATILASKWDQRSPFVNPMCGSGTLAIEAALIASNSRPGLFRTNYAFMHIAGYVEDIYLEERGRLEKQIIDVPARVIATDHSKQAIENARKNAQAAGVDDMIDFEVCDFADTLVPAGQKGVMFMNPEYGLRLGEVKELEATYARIGDFMKQKCGGYFGYVFTGNPDLAKKIGLKANRRIEFFNSTIECRLLEYELYEGTRRQQEAGG